MIVDWFEFAAWIVGVLLLYEGVAVGTQTRRSIFAKNFSIAGVIILLVGAALWYWSAQASHKLAETLKIPSIAINVNLDAEEFKNLPLPQRRDLSVNRARAVFVGGGELVDVATDNGLWIPYSPTKDDIVARDHQMKIVAELSLRRQELNLYAQISKNNSIRWLISLIVAICAGLASGRFRGQITNGFVLKE